MSNNIPRSLPTLIISLKIIIKHYYYLSLVENQDQEVIELSFNWSMVKLHKSFPAISSAWQW